MVETNFKHTEIGLIPHDWEVKTLGEIVIFRDNERIPIKDSDRKKMVGPYPYYGASGIIDYVNRYIFDDELILLGEDGANIIDRSSRLAFIVRGKCWINNHAHVLKPLSDISIGFLSEMLESFNYDQYNTGTAQPKLNRDKCNHIPIPLPPTLAEQERIAGALSSIDTLIGALNEQIEKKRHIKQGTMQQLLTGKKRLAGFTGEWKICKIKDIVGSVKRGQGLQSKDYVKGNIPVVAGGKQYAGFHNVANHFGCTITVSGSGANAGYVAFHAIPIFATDCSVIDDNDDFVLAFVYYVLLNKQSEIYKLQSGGAQPHIYPKNIEDIMVSIPPTIAEQSAIAAVLSRMDTEIAVLEQKRDKYIAIKSGMMQDLLTGKIRLV